MVLHLPNSGSNWNFEEKTGVAKEKTYSKLNPHMLRTPGFQSGQHWWRVIALTSASTLLIAYNFSLRLLLTSYANEIQLRHNQCPPTLIQRELPCDSQTGGRSVSTNFVAADCRSDSGFIWPLGDTILQGSMTAFVCFLSFRPEHPDTKTCSFYA